MYFKGDNTLQKYMHDLPWLHSARGFTSSLVFLLKSLLANMLYALPKADLFCFSGKTGHYCKVCTQLEAL